VMNNTVDHRLLPDAEFGEVGERSSGSVHYGRALMTAQATVLYDDACSICTGFANAMTPITFHA
jgi:hypothetical protein